MPKPSKKSSRARTLSRMRAEIPIVEFEHESESNSDPEISMRPILPTFKSQESVLDEANEEEIDIDFKQRFKSDMSMIPLKISSKKSASTGHVKTLKTPQLPLESESSDDVETDEEVSDDDNGISRKISHTLERGRTMTRGPTVDISDINLEPMKTPNSREDHYKHHVDQDGIELHDIPSNTNLNPNVSNNDISIGSKTSDEKHSNTFGNKFKLPKVSFLPSLSNVLNKNYHPNETNEEGDSLGKIRRGNQIDLEAADDPFTNQLFSPLEDYEYDYMQPKTEIKPKFGLTSNLIKLWDESQAAKKMNNAQGELLNSASQLPKDILDTNRLAKS